MGLRTVGVHTYALSRCGGRAGRQAEGFYDEDGLWVDKLGGMPGQVRAAHIWAVWSGRMAARFGVGAHVNKVWSGRVSALGQA